MPRIDHEFDASLAQRACDDSSPTLADLIAQPIEARAATIREAGRQQLHATLEQLHAETAAVPQRFGLDRLTWCLAWNAAGGHEPIDQEPASVRGGAGGYRSKWPANAQWSSVWDDLCAPRGKAGQLRRATWLGELALSVFCERRDDWQPPHTRPIAPAEAERAFEYVYTANCPLVLAALRRSSHAPHDAEAFANEAWARVYCNYWSVDAHSRFSGLSRLATFVGQVARYVAIDAHRARTRLSTPERRTAKDEEERPLEAVLQELGAIGDASRRVTLRESLEHIREGVARLTPRRRVVARMVWFRGMAASETARVLGISNAAVSQHLTAARARVAEHLREHGIDVPAAEPASGRPKSDE